MNTLYTCRIYYALYILKYKSYTDAINIKLIDIVRSKVYIAKVKSVYIASVSVHNV